MERSCGLMNKNRIEGVADQGERARNREALAINGKRRRSGRPCSEGVRSYLGRSRLVPERVTVLSRSEKSAEAILARGQAGEAGAIGEGPNGKECPASCRCDRQCVRCPCERGERE